MTSSDTLLRAAINRLAARFGQKFVDAAAEFAVIAKEAPDELKKEWELLKEEIYAEATRLSKEENERPGGFDTSSDDELATKDPQQKIDQLRAKVAEISQKIEVKN